jgi:hypothetical protein
LKRQLEGIPTALGRFVIAGVIYQNLPHKPGSDSKEVRAAFPFRRTLAKQAHVGFVNQSSALEGVIRALLLQGVAGETPELLVDERHEGVEGLPVAAAPTGQKVCDLAGGFRRFAGQWSLR